MKENADYAIRETLKHEGGYVNHPSDPGGATNMGITIGTYRQYIDPDASIGDIKNMSKDTAIKIYRKGYWDAIKGDDLPSGVDFAVYDFAVNSGPNRAAEFLQRLVGAGQDGIIGPETLRLVRKANPKNLVTGLCNSRMRFLRGLSTWDTFGRGWTARVEAVLQAATELVEVGQTEGQDRPTPRQVSSEVETNEPKSKSGVLFLILVFVILGVTIAEFIGFDLSGLFPSDIAEEIINEFDSNLNPLSR